MASLVDPAMAVGCMYSGRSYQAASGTGLQMDRLSRSGRMVHPVEVESQLNWRGAGLPPSQRGGVIQWSFDAFSFFILPMYLVYC